MTIEIGSIVELEDRAKKELVSHYESSRGICGMHPDDINKPFTVKYLDGCNLGVETFSGDAYSLNRNRFKLKEKEK